MLGGLAELADVDEEAHEAAAGSRSPGAAPAVVAALLPLLVVGLARSGRLGRGAGAALLGAYAVLVVAMLG